MNVKHILTIMSSHTHPASLKEIMDQTATTCITCGDPIPYGSDVCMPCENQEGVVPDRDGIPDPESHPNAEIGICSRCGSEMPPNDFGVTCSACESEEMPDQIDPRDPDYSWDNHNENFTFDKFMKRILVNEGAGSTPIDVETPQRRFIKKYRELPNNRIRFSK